MGSVILIGRVAKYWLGACYKQFVLLCVLFLVGNSAIAQGVEEKLKVAYLANIASFVKWSDSPQNVGLCVSDSSRLCLSLRQLDKYVLGEDRMISLIVNPDSMARCHMAFSDDDSSAVFVQKILAASGRILSISDTPQALLKGHRVQFFVRNLRLRFAIDTQALERTDYKISSKLLRLSRQLD